MFTVNNPTSARREYPNWNQRGRIKKLDAQGNIVPGEFAFNGEAVRVSPRYQKNGQHYRIRPERPAAFFAAFLAEAGVLPSLLTAEECQEEWGLEMLDPLWQQFSGNFFKLESPFAACDANTVPSHRVGFSFNIPQVLVEDLGAVRAVASRQGPQHATAKGQTNGTVLAVLAKRIEEMRARNGSAAPAKKKP